MSGIKRVIIAVGVFVLLVGLGAAGFAYLGLSQQSNALSGDLQLVSTENARLAGEMGRLEEWNSYQSTQIGAQQLTLGALLTSDPGGNEENPPIAVTLTPYDRIFGVVIEEGSCCVGGTAGETIEVNVEFFPKMNELPGAVVEMRVLSGGSNVTQAEMVSQPWEPFTAEKSFPATVFTNWTTFWVHVQFRTAEGVISAIYSDEIAVEGMLGFTLTP